MKFCPHCGNPFELKEVEGRVRFFCPRCQRIHYAHLKVGAGGLIEQNGGLLLLQRTQSPFQNSWNIPAGYAEVDESPSRTVVRETYEETGLQVEVDVLVDVYFFDDDPRGNGILIVYKCHLIGGELIATLEGTSPTFFNRNNLPADLAGGGHNQAIRAWQNS